MSGKLSLLKQIINEISKESYYPECPAKSKVTQFFDLVEWCRQRKDFNSFYKAYGMDLKSYDTKNNDLYFIPREFQPLRNKLNDCPSNQILLNKFLFYKHMKKCGLPVPEVYAYMVDGAVFTADEEAVDFEYLRQFSDYFIKDIDGQCASFVKHIKDFDELCELKEKLSRGSYLIQERVFQCEELQKLNPLAINTIRIVTKKKNGKPEIFAHLLRVGTSISGNVDNWAAGGLAVNINGNGELSKYGYYKLQYGTKESVHPDTGIVLEGFRVPYFEEAKELVLKAHESLGDLEAIGWDVTATTEGVKLIEGNHDFEITLHQMCDGPYKEKWFSFK